MNPAPLALSSQVLPKPDYLARLRKCSYRSSPLTRNYLVSIMWT